MGGCGYFDAHDASFAFGGGTIQLAEDALIEVGEHRMTHPVMSALPIAQQRPEIVERNLYLEQLLGYQVGCFAYPHGGDGKYNQDTVTVVRESGFDCACAAWPATIPSDIDAHQLPRFIVWNKNGETFAEQFIHAVGRLGAAVEQQQDISWRA